MSLPCLLCLTTTQDLGRTASLRRRRPLHIDTEEDVTTAPLRRSRIFGAAHRLLSVAGSWHPWTFAIGAGVRYRPSCGAL